MSQIQDLPRLISEFVEMARAYLIQETVEPAKRLGAFAGMSIGAAALWAVALVLLAVAGMRALTDLLPEGAYWEALAYLLFVIVVIGFLALVVNLVPSRGVHDGSARPSTPEGGDE